MTGAASMGSRLQFVRAQFNTADTVDMKNIEARSPVPKPMSGRIEDRQVGLRKCGPAYNNKKPLTQWKFENLHGLFADSIFHYFPHSIASF
jgi:hypothetical protein